MTGSESGVDLDFLIAFLHQQHAQRVKWRRKFSAFVLGTAQCGSSALHVYARKESVFFPRSIGVDVAFDTVT
jgi:hypothetical protein